MCGCEGGGGGGLARRGVPERGREGSFCARADRGEVAPCCDVKTSSRNWARKGSKAETRGARQDAAFEGPPRPERELGSRIRLTPSSAWPYIRLLERQTHAPSGSCAPSVLAARRLPSFIAPSLSPHLARPEIASRSRPVPQPERAVARVASTATMCVLCPAFVQPAEPRRRPSGLASGGRRAVIRCRLETDPTPPGL